MKVTKKNIDMLGQVLKENDLTSIEYKDSEYTITLSKNSSIEQVSNLKNNEKKIENKEVVTKKQEQVKEVENLIELKVPIVGNIYLRKAPDQPNFVKKGDEIKKGDIVAIVEAMKVMNEIKAETSGTIHKICVENGDYVDADTTIMELI